MMRIDPPNIHEIQPMGGPPYPTPTPNIISIISNEANNLYQGGMASSMVQAYDQALSDALKPLGNFLQTNNALYKSDANFYTTLTGYVEACSQAGPGQHATLPNQANPLNVNTSSWPPMPTSNNVQDFNNWLMHLVPGITKLIEQPLSRPMEIWINALEGRF